MLTGSLGPQRRSASTLSHPAEESHQANPRPAKYHCATQPRSRSEHRASLPPTTNPVRERWKRVGAVVHRADSDDTSADDADPNDPERTRRRIQKAEREKYARRMGLEYFLEMVDHKHRYGSNLRRYHAVWKTSDTQENFFYWLDYGEGRTVDLQERPRRRLDTELVRYLSREERAKYLVRIDGEGLFRWVKNGELVTTSAEFRDSIDGIVPVDDPTPTWREVTTGQKPAPIYGCSSASSIASDSSSLISTSSPDSSNSAPSTNPNLDPTNTPPQEQKKKKKKPTWIFVADTSFRLYISIKSSGAFQHSSFLHGSRVAAAGKLEIRRGRLRALDPLSGHYAPPLKNFREFVRSLKDAGADLGRCSIGRSYAVLLGLEGYLGVKKGFKGARKGMKGLFLGEEEGEGEGKQGKGDGEVEEKGRRAVMARRRKSVVGESN